MSQEKIPEDRESQKIQPKLSKEEKKALKEKQLAEKLAKLAKKKEAQKEQPEKKAVPKPKKSGGYDPTPIEAKWTEYWKKNETFKCENSIFKGENTTKDKKPFCMVIPPPNITGSLHIGHAMMVSIEDAIVRYQRLQGKEVLYLPGLDHAGIATQSVVMKKIARETPEKCIDREYFTKTAHEWSDAYGNRIIDQFNRLGTSLDFSKQMFTLDPKVSQSVNKAFVKLHDQGLIYRENKIVNWSGKMQTTLSDLEVNYKEVQGGDMITVDGKEYQMAMMYYIKYYIIQEDSKAEIEKKINECIGSEKAYEKINSEIYSKLPYVIIGTTRPETILGDTALCINPDDERFKDTAKIFKDCQVQDVMNDNKRQEVKPVEEKEELDLNEQIKQERRNKYKTNQQTEEESTPKRTTLLAINPLTYKLIPIIQDSHADLTLGTGMLKVTPAHDQVDFKLGKKHNLETLCMMDGSNMITVEGEYKGLMRLECRQRIINHPCCIKEEKRTQILPFCSRSNDLVEPMVKAQWWLNCDEMAARSVDGVRTGDINLYPEEAKSIWYRWLENIRGWCLSRQLWWGHRVPAYKYQKGEEEQWIVAETREAAELIQKERGDEKYQLQQDEDVLDTWFSSGLWPFSTLGWGWDDKSPLLEKYFPNSLLETGSDILFFWVARMVMLSYALTDKKPFDSILLHGIVRDAHGRKMSKSLGNVIDPIFVIEGVTQKELIDNISVNVSKNEIERAKESIKLDYPNGIPKCGADAIRFALLSYTNGMKDINLDILRVAGYSRLCNKIHNASKFVMMKFKGVNSTIVEIESGEFLKSAELLEHHKFILDKLNQCIQAQHSSIEEYNFMASTQSLHMFFLYMFCDVYIELMKQFDDELDKKILIYTFVSFLKLLHPAMPFITQEIYNQLHTKVENKSNPEEVKIIRDYPSALERDLSHEFDDIIAVAKEIRTVGSAKVNIHKKYLECLCKETKIEEGEGKETIGALKYTKEE